MRPTILSGSTQGLADVERLLETLSGLEASAVPEARSLFSSGGDIYVARAPGRLDLMGGIADYSGSLVLQLPLKEATLVAVQRDSRRSLAIVSLNQAVAQPARDLPLAHFEEGGVAGTYASAQEYFRSDPSRRWAAYVAGALLVLRHEKGARFPEGARVLISSEVPLGKGVASSAALEVAAMTALAAAFGVPLEFREIALLSQKVENLVVGAACGVMDQMTAACGERDRLLCLVCQPAELGGSIPLPPDLTVAGIDSGSAHAVSGSEYTAVRVGAFMGYRMIADMAGLACERLGDGRVAVRDPLWQGHLANIPPALFASRFEPNLPLRMRGWEFLERYGGTTDAVARVDESCDYAVRVPTAHPIHEHFRVRAFAKLLREESTEKRRFQLGELMYQSHASYSACGLGSPGTDRVVALARASGPSGGIYGAKITGGGSGGTVAILGRGGEEGAQAIARVAEVYARETGGGVKVFRGSSQGAASFGHLVVGAQPVAF